MRTARVLLLCLAILLAGLLASCRNEGDNALALYYFIQSYFKDPSTMPVKGVIRTSVPLAYSASVAMSAVTGSIISNATTTTTCSSYPCTATVTIADDDSAMPLLLGDFGKITVYGHWRSADEAVVSVVFDRDTGSSLVPVHSISMVPVSRANGILRLTYGSVDLNAAVAAPDTWDVADIDLAWVKLDIASSSNAAVNVAMEAWHTDVDSRNTGTVSDDIYTVGGGGQYIAVGGQTAAILQIGLADVTLGPDCALNPDSGDAVLQEVGVNSSSAMLGQAVFSFHAVCDGAADVESGNGNYVRAAGSSFALNLTTP